MSFETDFDAAFTILLGKAQSNLTTSNPSTPPDTSTGGSSGGTTTTSSVTAYAACFEWGGGGAAIVPASTDPILVEVPDAGEIVSVHLYAGNASGSPVAVSAVLDLERTSFGSLGSSTSLPGTGSTPRLSSESQANISLAGWNTHLSGGDVLVARIVTFTGTATWLACVVRIRRD